MLQIRNIVLAALAGGLLSNSVFAQAPPASSTTYTGSISAGVAVTNGNTDTTNYNIAFALIRDPKTKNVIKSSALYLRGDQNSILAVDRTTANLRDEYTVSGRTFVFGQTDYFRDRFKDINYLVSPTAGVGYKLVSRENTLILLDGGAGGLWEKDTGLPVTSSGSITAGERFSSKVNSALTFAQSINTLWKTDDFSDSLSNFAASATTSISKRLDMKVEFIDSYKNRPAILGIKKNDTAFVTALVFKFQDK
jgi:putative salt-induced outer membrane protein YdiY